jgi:hypothetical protein
MQYMYWLLNFKNRQNQKIKKSKAMAKKINAAQTIGDEETELPDRSTRLQ